MEEMRKEFANISKNKASGSSPDLAPLIVLPQLSSLQSMDGVVSVHKNLHERLHVEFIDLAESLTHQAEKFFVCPANNKNCENIVYFVCLFVFYYLLLSGFVDYLC